MIAAFRCFAALFAGGLAYHATCLVRPELGHVPPWRHALFVLINAICVYGFLRRPRWFRWAFAVLVIEQWWSHGGDALIAWRAGKIDYVSIGIVLVLPIGAVLLFRAGVRATVSAWPREPSTTRSS